MSTETRASVAVALCTACLIALCAWAYAGTAAINLAAGCESPNYTAHKRPSPDAGAFLLPGRCVLGLCEAQPALRRAAWGSRKARRSVCRSLNPASSATTGESAVADSIAHTESTPMLTPEDRAAEAARLREEAAHLRATNPFYRLSFYTCNDRTDGVFTCPPVPRGNVAAAALGEAMAVELMQAIQAAADLGLANTSATVMRRVVRGCKAPWVVAGFTAAIGQYLADSLDWYDPTQWRERRLAREAAAFQAYERLCVARETVAAADARLAA